jgi:RNA polymerase sigma-70 factor (ECF subfamily)
MGKVTTIERRAVQSALALRMDIAEEDQWLVAARRGEGWALERLYTLFHEPVYRLCCRILGNPEDAEDALQSTFVSAFRGIARFGGRCAVRTWLYRIAVNQCADLRRRRGASPLLSVGPAHGDFDVAGPDSTAAVADRLVVERALAVLKPEFRTILILRFWEEMDYAEMAAVLGLSISAAKMRLKRARDAFRRQYESGERMVAKGGEHGQATSR